MTTIKMREGHYTSVPVKGQPRFPRLIGTLDGLVEVEDGLALYLNRAGAADIVGQIPDDPAPAEERKESVDPVPEEKPVGVTPLEELAKSALIEMAKELGVYSAALRTKTQLIEAIREDEGLPVFNL